MPTAGFDRFTLAPLHPGMEPGFAQPPMTELGKSQQRQPNRQDDRSLPPFSCNLSLALFHAPVSSPDHDYSHCALQKRQ